MPPARKTSLFGSIRRRIASLIEADLSFDDKERALQDAIGTLKPAAADDSWYAWVDDVFDDTFVFTADLDLDGDVDLYRATYTIGANGEAEIGTPEQVRKQTTYVVVTDDEATESRRQIEFSSPGLIPLREGKTIRDDGSFLLKIMKEGWGSSGYYGKDVIARDIADFAPKGTKMYLDHPTPLEEQGRPERSVKDLAAEFTGDPYWAADGPDGAGAYVDAKAIGPFKDVIEQLAPHIGASIRGFGLPSKTPQTIDGRTGPVIEKLVKAKSVDFVTEAGAGGKIVQLLESARANAAITATKERADMGDPIKLEEVQRELEEAKTGRARAEGALVLREAADYAARAVAKVEGLPDFAKTRLVENVAKNPPIKDGKLDEAAFAAVIEKAAKEEVAYLSKITGGGQIHGMGGGAGGSERDFTKELTESFMRMGYDEAAAKAMAAGRSN